MFCSPSWRVVPLVNFSIFPSATLASQHVQKMIMNTHNTTIILKCTGYIHNLHVDLSAKCILEPWDPMDRFFNQQASYCGPVTCLTSRSWWRKWIPRIRASIGKNWWMPLVHPRVAWLALEIEISWEYHLVTSARSENGWWVKCTFSCFWTQCRILRKLDQLLSHWEDVLMHWPEDTFGSHTLAFASQQDCCFTFPGNLFERVCVELKNSTFVWPLLSIVATWFCYYPSEYWMIPIHLIRYWMSNCRIR